MNTLPLDAGETMLVLITRSDFKKNDLNIIKKNIGLFFNKNEYEKDVDIFKLFLNGERDVLVGRSANASTSNIITRISMPHTDLSYHQEKTVTLYKDAIKLMIDNYFNPVFELTGPSTKFNKALL